MKKIILGIFIGCVLCYVSFYPYESEIATELSPNGKYKLIYESDRHGGIFTGYYRRYIKVINVSSNKNLFIHFVESADENTDSNRAYWDGDKIIVTGNDFYSNDRKLQKIEVTREHTIFYFPEGYATK